MESLIEKTLANSAKVKALSEEKGNSNEIKELLTSMRAGKILPFSQLFSLIIICCRRFERYNSDGSQLLPQREEY